MNFGREARRRAPLWWRQRRTAVAAAEPSLANERERLTAPVVGGNSGSRPPDLMTGLKIQN